MMQYEVRIVACQWAHLHIISLSQGKGRRPAPELYVGHEYCISISTDQAHWKNEANGIRWIEQGISSKVKKSEEQKCSSTAL